MDTPDAGEQLGTILRALTDSQTLVREPQKTIVPARDPDRGAFVALQRLAPMALQTGPTIGAGGMGIVREATQVSLERKVAVKTLRAEQADAGAVAALLAEARLTGGLEHPNIVPVHDLALDDRGLPVMVMKRVEGVTWSTLLHEPLQMAAHAPGQAPLDEHLRILIQVCRALEFAHSRGVVHRDLKPDNVMVGRFGEVFIVDWGIARASGPATQLAGTPAYLAPEMLGGSGALLGPFTDVYLLGAVLYEVLAGRPPHAGSSLEQMVQSVLTSRPDFPPGAPPELVELTTGCMKAQPVERPQSVALVRDALENFLRHQGSRELTAQTEVRLGELIGLLAQPAPEPKRVASLFSECRFGFQQALRSWEGNTRASEGLRRTVATVARHELDHGSASAANAMLSDLPRTDPGLASDVKRALAAEQARQRQLEEIERAQDPGVGGPTRARVAMGLGVLWALAPFLGLFVPQAQEGRGAAALSVVSVVMIAVAWQVERTNQSVLNNLRVLRFLAVGMLAEAAVLTAYEHFYGPPGVAVIPIALGYGSLLTLLVAVTMEPHVWPSGLAYFLAMLLGLRWPSVRYVGALTANAVLCLNALWLRRRNPMR